MKAPATAVASSTAREASGAHAAPELASGLTASHGGAFAAPVPNGRPRSQRWPVAFALVFAIVGAGAAAYVWHWNRTRTDDARLALTSHAGTERSVPAPPTRTSATRVETRSRDRARANGLSSDPTNGGSATASAGQTSEFRSEAAANSASSEGPPATGAPSMATTGSEPVPPDDSGAGPSTTESHWPAAVVATMDGVGEVRRVDPALGADQDATEIRRPASSVGATGGATATRDSRGNAQPVSAGAMPRREPSAMAAAASTRGSAVGARVPAMVSGPEVATARSAPSDSAGRAASAARPDPAIDGRPVATSDDATMRTREAAAAAAASSSRAAPSRRSATTASDRESPRGGARSPSRNAAPRSTGSDRRQAATARDRAPATRSARAGDSTGLRPRVPALDDAGELDPAGEEARLRARLAEAPDDTDARVALAALLVSRGAEREADAVLAEHDADEETARLRRIDVLARAGRAQEARAELGALSEASRATPSARMSEARLALAEGRAEEAMRILQPFAQSSDASAALLALYAQAALAAGRVEAASDAYRASVERDAALPEALLGRAEMAVRSRRPHDALRTLARLERALEAQPRPPPFRSRALLIRGRAELMSGQASAARRTLARVVASPDAPSEAFFFLGEAHAGSDYRAARAAYEAYLEREPNGYYATRARRALGIDER